MQYIIIALVTMGKMPLLLQIPRKIWLPIFLVLCLQSINFRKFKNTFTKISTDI